MTTQILTPRDFNQQEARNLRFHQLAAAPGSPVEGQPYWDTVAHKLFVWDGTAWTLKASDSALLNAQNAAFYLARANHTGTQLAATVSDFDTQVHLSRLDQMAAPTADVSFNTHKATNVLAGTASTDAVNKAQLDAVAAGLADPKDSVRAALTTNLAGITYTAAGGASARGQITVAPNTLDGVALAANNRIALLGQTTGAQNGIYVVTTLGTGANGVWDRATDFDADAEVTSGTFFFVTEGTLNADTGWFLSTNDPITIGGAGGTTLVFSPLPGLGALVAGAGMTRTGNTLDVIGGTGITFAADLVSVDTTVVARKYTTQLTGSTTSYVVNHALGNQWVTAQVVRNSGAFDLVDVDIELTDANNVTVRFATAPASNAYRAVVVG